MAPNHVIYWRSLRRRLLKCPWGGGKGPVNSWYKTHYVPHGPHNPSPYLDTAVAGVKPANSFKQNTL